MLSYKEGYFAYCGQGCYTLWLFKNRLWRYEFRLKIIARTGGQYIVYQQYPDNRAETGNKDDRISTYSGFFDNIISADEKRDHLLKQRFAVIN